MELVLLQLDFHLVFLYFVFVKDILSPQIQVATLININHGGSWENEISLPDNLTSTSLKRQREYKAGRWCANQALRALSHHVVAIGIGQTDHGPCWPDGIVGSLTHTRTFAMAAVARADTFYGIGIDAEEILSKERATKIQKKILTNQESKHFHDWCELGSIQPNILLTLIFSAKESLFKCLNPLVKKFFGFQCALITKIDFVQTQFEIQLTQEVSPNFPAGYKLEGKYILQNDLIITAIELRKV